MKQKIAAGLLAMATMHAVNATGTPLDFSATEQTVGPDTTGSTPNGVMTPVNQIVTPAGRQIVLPGLWPHALALSPDRHILVTAGRTHELIILDPATGNILQHVPLPSAHAHTEASLTSQGSDVDSQGQLSFAGLAFSPDGSRLYGANVKGDLKVFGVGDDHLVSPLFSIALPPVNAPGRTTEIPAGVAVSSDGKKIYVALNLSNRLAELDAMTGNLLRTWDVGVAPFDVAVAGKKVYVSNWGGRRPAPGELSGPAGLGTRVRVDPVRHVASEGSISVIDVAGNADPAPAQPLREIPAGLHASALALSPNGKYLAVANAGSDTVTVVDTRSDQTVETILLRQNPGDPFGAQPDALAFDKSGRTLFVCNGTQNAVAMVEFDPGKAKLLGLIPVGWFPGAIVFDSARKQIVVANLKGILGGNGPFNAGDTVASSLSIVPLPGEKALGRFTETALANLRYPLLAQARLPARPDQPPRPVPERVGEPSVFQHVIYIIKENRTYDQVLGDVSFGRGNAKLCNFGAWVTPNQHRLVRDFVLLDNTYCCGYVSADGHQWADSALANDYAERSQASNWPRSYAFCGEDALVLSPAGCIWDDAVAHGKTVRDYGEFTATRVEWKDPRRHEPLDFLANYRNFVTGANAITYHCEPMVESIRPFLDPDTPGWDLYVPDIIRSARFIKELRQFEQTGNFPNLLVLWLPSDHTSGTQPGAPTPDAQMADNDLALGQVVDAVSHSRFWTNTCIFAIEDDPQAGWDHISGFRTTAYVASAYTRRGVTVSTQYNQTSLLRTMELMLGLPPMNQMDATATPMFDCFTNAPDFTAYTASTNNVPLDRMNPSPKKISNSQLRHDAYVSARLPLAKEDQCPEDLFNHILWRATMGTQAPYPDWAVNHTDND